MVSKVSSSFSPEVLSIDRLQIRVRCTAPSDGLDSDEYPRRSHEHTRALLNAFDPRTLWDEYGVVSDVIVSASA